MAQNESNDSQFAKDDDLESMQVLDSTQNDGDEEDLEEVDQEEEEQEDGEPTYDPTVPSEEGTEENTLEKSEENKDDKAENGNKRDGDEKGKFENGRIRLSGSSKKRLKYFLATGHSREEARKLAMDKRVRITDWDKYKEIQKQKPPTRAEVETIDVGILPENYPLASISTDDMEAIQGEILNKVIEKGGEIKPKFLGTSYKTGWFVLKCANKETAEWIKGISSELQGPGGQILKVVDNGDVPETTVVYAYFPKSAEDSDEKVLQLIAAQNDKLNVTQWRVTKREIDGHSLKLSIAIDPASDEVLQTLTYRIAYKFGSINLRTEDKQKERIALRKSGIVPPSPKRRIRPPIRSRTPPRRRISPPRRFERPRPRPRPRGGRRERFEGRRSPRGSPRGGASRFSSGIRDRREPRGGRFMAERFARRDRDSGPSFNSDMSRMPPPSNYPPPSNWGDNYPTASDMGKSSAEMAMYFTQLKSLEEYNKTLGQQPPGGGGWFTQHGGPGSFGNQRR